VDRADADGNGSVDLTEFRQLFAADARARAQRDQVFGPPPPVLTGHVSSFPSY
jgi:hypothetical protein